MSISCAVFARGGSISSFTIKDSVATVQVPDTWVPGAEEVGDIMPTHCLGIRGPFFQ